jgi:hypothetical protein
MVEKIVNESSADGETVIDVIDVIDVGKRKQQH